MKLQKLISGGRRWLSSTPERALDAAYSAAIKIKAIEDDYFQGQKVAAESSDYSDSAIAFFRTDVDNYLKKIRLRLAEFRISRAFSIFSDTPASFSQPHPIEDETSQYSQNLSIVEKLNFIDRVISKYKNEPKNSLTVRSDSGEPRLKEKEISLQKKDFTAPKNSKGTPIETISDKTSVLPRSIMRTFNRIRQEIDPQSQDSEEKVLKKFRQSRNKTAISIRFLLILIIVPLFTHQFSKTFLISPLVERYFINHEQIIFINRNLEEEAFIELHRHEEHLHFQSLVGLAPPLSPKEVEQELQQKAEELAEEYRYRGIDAISNIFADIFSLLAFSLIILTSKKEIMIVKSFLDEVVYGLSDSAKAFLIILVTDMFVGYHSPHGWEVILESISRHLGLPENRDFNFLFIATFPVILDTVLKYWIFRYLNRISPSSVATYKNMNE
ncbi:proton extrusion protein PcxA [Pleurocapsales cyanobacterium LEGE 06147]|nr:proton extrusion protein PcxA [Pleurocapsales cyanobacterium LEGE 06147]